MENYDTWKLATPPEGKEEPTTATCYCCDHQFMIDEMRAEVVSPGTTYYYCAGCDINEDTAQETPSNLHPLFEQLLKPFGIK